MPSPTSVPTHPSRCQREMWGTVRSSATCTALASISVPASRPGCRPPSPWRSIDAAWRVTRSSSTSPRQLSPGGTTPPTPRYKLWLPRSKPRTPRSLDPLMSTLEIRDLHVSVDTEAGAKPILKGVDLTIRSGETHAIMGPNGSGKSTLAYSIAGHPKYQVTSGQVLLDGEDVLAMSVDERARAGLFLAMQYPVEVPGVSVSNFLRTAATAVTGEAPKLRTWVKDVRTEMQALEMDSAFAERNVNEGFSGGEKKRHEILQMRLLKPRIAILDETDSGLDVDALRVVSEGVNRVKATSDVGVMLITHYTRILRYIRPDFVHVFIDGRI